MIQFDAFDPETHAGNPHCVACEQMLPDMLDGTLTAVEQAWFDGHIQSCVACSRMTADAQRGAAWLELLKTPRPQPSEQLLARIIAQTAGMEAGVSDGSDLPSSGLNVLSPAATDAFLPERAPLAGGSLLTFPPRKPAAHRLAFTRVMFEPRLAMTAAMAFFSIALTLNLTGFRLNEWHARDLNPTHLRRTYYAANAQAVRYYDNLRVVRVLQSRVDDLRESNGDTRQDGQSPESSKPMEQPAGHPGQQKGHEPERKEPKEGHGVSRRREAPLPDSSPGVSGQPPADTNRKRSQAPEQSTIQRGITEGGLA